MVIGLIRLVTMALAMYSPRALDTFTTSPPRNPMSFASSAGISTNGSGTRWSAGFESALNSVTSLPTHFCVGSLHHTCRREASHGLPSRSHDARLYRTRRFAGHDQAQFWCTPIPDGSLGSLRAVKLPASVYPPQ